MENSEFELQTNGVSTKIHRIKSGDECLNVSVRLFKSQSGLDTVGFRTNPVNETVQQKKYNISFNTNDALSWTFHGVNQQNEFSIDLSLLKHKLHNPSKIICKIDVVNPQEQQLPLPLQPNEHENQMKNALNELLRCSACFDLMKMRNIYVCKEGHSVVCEGCFHKLNPKNCPECRAQMTTKRNYSLEKIRDVLLFSNESNNTNIPTYNRDEANIEHTTTDFLPCINITKNLGSILIEGIVEIFEWFANATNWNHNDRRNFLIIFVFILEVYVLFAVLSFTIFIFGIQIKANILLNPVIIVLVLNLSPPYQYFFNANANDNVLIDISKNFGYILIERIIKKLFECVANALNWNQTDRRKFLKVFFLILEVYVLCAVVAFTLVIFRKRIPLEFFMYIVIVVIVLNLAPSTFNIFFGQRHLIIRQ